MDLIKFVFVFLLLFPFIARKINSRSLSFDDFGSSRASPAPARLPMWNQVVRYLLASCYHLRTKENSQPEPSALWRRGE